MDDFHKKLDELSERVLGKKTSTKSSETLLVFDAEENTSISIEVNLENTIDDRELEFFFDDTIRKVWHKQEEEWYFSIVDVCRVLTDSADAAAYWRKLKQRLKSEGNETVTNCHALKMKATDGKMRLTDCANTEQLLRIIQSIPSKNAEPFKLWLAQTGKERLDEIADPELNQLAEVSATAISQAKNPKGYNQTKDTVIEGGTIAGNARKELEERIGRSVISPLNAQSPALLDESDSE